MAGEPEEGFEDRVDTAERRRERLRELVVLWDAYRGTSDPVAAAFALGEFANEMTHLRWQLEEEGEIFED